MEVGTRLKNMVSGVCGTFVKENVSGYKRVTIIKTDDGREYFGPTIDFKIIDYDKPDAHGNVYMKGCFDNSIGCLKNGKVLPLNGVDKSEIKITNQDIVNAFERFPYSVAMKPNKVYFTEKGNMIIAHERPETIADKYLNKQYEKNKSIVEKWKQGYFKALFERFKK